MAAPQIISLGIGSPESVPWFITLGLLPAAAAAPADVKSDWRFNRHFARQIQDELYRPRPWQ